MDSSLILLCFYCFLLNAGTLASSFHNSIGTFSNISQTFEILNDFHAYTGPFRRVLSKYYHVERTDQLTWFSAVHRCRHLGGDLVNFQNNDELKKVIRILDARHCYWLDSTNFAEPSRFSSMTTGFPSSFLRWGSVEPNNLGNNEHCVELVAYDRKRFIMNDNQCNRLCFFICETKLPSQTNIVVW